MKVHRFRVYRQLASVFMVSIAMVAAPPMSAAQNFTSNVTVTTNDTPSLKLQQSAAGGFGARNWRAAANESLFFIHDETANRFPFEISANAPSDSLVIGSDGTVGLGVLTPIGNGRSLHIFGNTTDDVFSGLGPNPNTGPAFNFGYSGSSFGRSSGFFNVRPDASAVAPNPSLRFAIGNVQRMIITNLGRVGIGTLDPQQLLEVTGTVRAQAFQVGTQNLNVPDYVFEPNYKLLPLKQLAMYVEKEKHLPEVPSAKEIKANGVDLSTFQMQLLKKVEELTLYTLEQEQTATTQQRKIRTQDETIAQLRTTVVQLTDTLKEVTARLTVLEQDQKR